MRLLDAVGGNEFGNDPAGPLDELTDEVRVKMRRIPTVVAILRQLDRVNYLLSTNMDAASAVQALYAVSSPYLKRAPGWVERWAQRPCAGVRIGDRWVPTPQPSDYGAWLELIMDGLAEAGVIFDETRVSTVGPRKELKPVGEAESGPQLPVGPPGVGVPGALGAGPVGVGASSGVVGLGARVGAGGRGGSLVVRVQPGRRFKRPVPVDVGAPGVSVDVPRSPPEPQSGP